MNSLLLTIAGLLFVFALMMHHECLLSVRVSDFPGSGSVHAQNLVLVNFSGQKTLNCEQLQLSSEPGWATADRLHRNRDARRCSVPLPLDQFDSRKMFQLNERALADVCRRVSSRHRLALLYRKT